MKEITSDINIIGGGLIGAATAYSLSQLGYKTTIIEKKASFVSELHDDQRTVAISEGTKNFLEKINLWSKIKNFSQPIKQIKVIDRNLSNKLEFNNKRRNSNLGYIVKNKHILEIIYTNLKNDKKVSIINNSKSLDFEITKNSIVTYSNNYKVVSKLNIAADGKKSFVKKYFKTPVFYKNYNKMALVVTLLHSKDHQDNAFEFFYKNGPLAILPMQKESNRFASSIIWTNKTSSSKFFFEMDNKKLESILNRETQNCIGDINKIITKQIFPISAHINTRFFDEKTIYIGDAAHSFHPIAGQGWNLGMKDLDNLLTLLLKYQNLGLDIGNSIFCKQYNSDNFYNAYRLYQLTDKLDSIFKIRSPIITSGRRLGLNFIQKNRWINNLISDFAMGIS